LIQPGPRKQIFQSRLGPMRSPKIAALFLVALSLSGPVGCVQTTASFQAPGFSPAMLAVRGVKIGSLQNEAPGPNLTSRDEAVLVAALSRELSKNKKVFVTHSPNGLLLNTTVTFNNVDRWVSQNCQSVEEPVRNDDGEEVGKVTRTTYTTSAHARRSVEASFSLVDPANGKVTWAWSGTTSQENSRSHQSDCCFPVPPLFPEPPMTHQVADSLMRTAVRKLTAK
jgi:hypothetical protein